MTDQETIKRVITALQAETLKRGQVAAIKARVKDLRGGDLREALKTAAYYQRALNAAVLEFYRDGEAGAFIDEMIRLIEGQFTRAWNEGGRAVGIQPKNHTEEDDAELQRHIDNEIEFILPFAEEIEAARIAETGPKPFQARVPLWVNRYNEMVNAAMLWFGGQERLEWVLGATEDHCEQCANLDGIVATARAWDESGFHPQGAPNELLECGGWRCDCSLSPTKKPATDKQPEDVKPK